MTELNHTIIESYMNNIAIGIRVKTGCVVYSIIKEKDDENLEISIVDKVNVPVSMEIPEQLKFLRSTFLDIIYENKVNRGCIRVAESTAQKVSRDRISIEAVLQELIASSTIEHYYIGRISNISSKLGIDRNQFKPIIESNTCKFFEDWNTFNKEQKESLLASLSALNL